MLFTKSTIGIQERWSDYVFSDYRVGCNSCGWSDLFEFSTFPSYDENWSPTLALYGDMGNVNAVSLPTLQKEAQSGRYDLILHVGDFAYDMYNVIANLLMFRLHFLGKKLFFYYLGSWKKRRWISSTNWTYFSLRTLRDLSRKPRRKIVSWFPDSNKWFDLLSNHSKHNPILELKWNSKVFSYF